MVYENAGEASEAYRITSRRSELKPEEQMVEVRPTTPSKKGNRSMLLRNETPPRKGSQTIKTLTTKGGKKG